ncbi:response regulator [Dyella sp. A6]|uniref:response regulator n=1 Tax=Dyella aluminiiresistens TaxID=3069105 RepID=UPI002E7A9A16|nr:response regulator [Dyella sp. A6]
MPLTRSEPEAVPRPHLLVVEDEEEIRALIERYFGNHGFRVSTAADGMVMRETIRREHVDLVLLDLGLPHEDGFELCRYLREHWHGAIIMVTGRSESVDRVVGLELGADDYVTKPFDLRELLARVRSVMRRVLPATTEADAVPHETWLVFAGFRLNPRTRVLLDAQGVEVALTSGEHELLQVLLNHPNRVLSRDQLMGYTHGRDAGPYDRAIDVQIGRLRRKIEHDPAHPQLIKSVRGAGYLFTPQVQRR